MANRLQHETSPYLLQHADNPVDWHPWDESALQLAREMRKPILLSIGYSACHWCHVMAHESFEDAATASVMNELFINIKVDREERPDIDRIYQLAQQMFTGRAGGWPLTVFLTPDEHLPIFAGTYFPKTTNFGMPAFTSVLERVESYYRTHPDEVRQNGDSLLSALENLNSHTATTDAEFSLQPLFEARRRLGESFDAKFGGFGAAPKFPHPTNLDFLLGHWQRSKDAGEPDSAAWTMIERSLTQMATRGLYDHLGGGFYRYCVDQHWGIPHFEKMLYDNAALLATYADAYRATGHDLYRRTASDTADWVLRDMRDRRGGFYSTFDADSEGEEGKFYVFTPEDFDSILDPEEAAAAKAHYGLDQPANFEGHAWHLLVKPELETSVADDLLTRARGKLLAARNQRVWPGRDEKLLVAWNGMMIGALAKSARHLERPELGAAAEQAVDFIATTLWQGGRLNATFKDGRARFAGYLDDYAFLAAGLLELLQWKFRAADLDFATELADAILAHFSDPNGGFFFTADDHEQLIHRPKPIADEAIPAGSSIAARVLNDLGHLLGEPRYLEAARKTVQAALPSVREHPEAYSTLLRSLERELEPPELVILRGDPDVLKRWRSTVDHGYTPRRLIFAIPNNVTDLPGLLNQRQADGDGVAYVCQGTTCQAPIRDLAELKASLAVKTR